MLLCVGGAVLGRMQTGARTDGKVDIASRTVRTTIEPAASALTGAANWMSDFTAGIAESAALKAENRRLKEVARAAALYGETVSRITSESARLRKLLDLPKVPGRSRIAGTVIGYMPTENRITISVGRATGVRQGMPVVTADGLAGVIQTVDATSCQALLISSPRLPVGALIRRDPPTAGIVRGESARSLSLDYLDMQASVQVGDLVETSGYSERIPPGIPIGKVIQVQDDPEYGSRRCQVFPNVQVGTLRDVYVLR